MRRTLLSAPGGWIRRAGPRRVLLAAVLLAVIVVPLPGPASEQQAATRSAPREGSAERWTARLPGQWAIGDGATAPVSGQAYVAAGGGLAAVGDGLTVATWRLSDGTPLWRLSLDAPRGSSITSVRAWPGVVTAGVVGPSGAARTEVVISASTGTVLGRYPARLFGGAVDATPSATVIIGNDTVTSYDNATGRVRWQHRTGAGPWRADGATLYVARQSGGPLGAGPVTGLQVIDLNSGTERIVPPGAGHHFHGTLSAAADGVVVFTSASGVTAYSARTGRDLWSARGAVPEGSDPGAGLIYLTDSGGTLTGVRPLTGKAVTSVPGSAATGSAGMYVVRGGIALGLDSGAGGQAWGYSVTAGRVTWTVPGLPWPHYFSDLAGVGGSAAASGDVVLIAACGRLAQAAPAPPAGSPSPSGGPSPPTS
ncbi:MAG: PQQ-binding-like beta-propeller repeat protein, partial [Nocardiopsaceae bacterium]|nr:PQQ-binding-like beta-propeller repeat protein [Nocardiopsaceae bacterium]